MFVYLIFLMLLAQILEMDLGPTDQDTKASTEGMSPDPRYNINITVLFKVLNILKGRLLHKAVVMWDLGSTKSTQLTM